MLKSVDFSKKDPSVNMRERILQHFQMLDYKKTQQVEYLDILKDIKHLLLTNGLNLILILIENLPDSDFNKPEDFAQNLWFLPAVRNFTFYQKKKGVTLKLFWVLSRFQFQSLAYGFAQHIINEIQIILVSKTTLEFLKLGPDL